MKTFNNSLKFISVGQGVELPTLCIMYEVFDNP